MALAGSMGLSHEFPTCRNYIRINQNKDLIGKRQLRLGSFNLSSCALSKDAWSVNLLCRVQCPIKPTSPRYNVLMCRSILVPCGEIRSHALKASVVVACRRSYNVIYGSPLIQKMLPGIGIITFSIWGLGPLVRLTRNIFLHKSDISWKKSSMQYILTSYIRPLLLWTGATLICSALDPVNLTSEASQAVKQRLLIFVRSLSTVLAFSYSLSRKLFLRIWISYIFFRSNTFKNNFQQAAPNQTLGWPRLVCSVHLRPTPLLDHLLGLVQQAQQLSLGKDESEYTTNMGLQFAGKAVYVAVWVAAVSLFMELLGFSTQKLMTAGGLGTVLLTLSGREIFRNFLSSVMIYATRPFVLNERIKAKIDGSEVSGRVEHVGWWSQTIIRGDEREAVHIPNYKFTGNIVRNLSHKTHWRLKTHLAISHLDINKINVIVADMRKVLVKNPQVEQQRLHRRVFLDYVDPKNQALMILISCFVKTSHSEEYLCVKEAILQDLLRVISYHRARLATPIRTVQNMYSDVDIDIIPFSDSLFTSPKPEPDRPFLLDEKKSKLSSSSSGRSTTKIVENNTNITRPRTGDTVSNSGRSTAKYVENSTNTTRPKTEDSTSKKSRLTSQESGSQKAKKSMAASQGKQPTAKSRLEDNIVLGVALDSSKRTLAIDDDTVSSPLESKELTAKFGTEINGDFRCRKW